MPRSNDSPMLLCVIGHARVEDDALQQLFPIHKLQGLIWLPECFHKASAAHLMTTISCSVVLFNEYRKDA